MLNINFQREVLPVIVLVALVLGAAIGISEWSKVDIEFQNKVVFSRKDETGDKVYSVGDVLKESRTGADLNGNVYFYLTNDSDQIIISGPASAMSMRTTSNNAQILTEGEGTVTGYTQEAPYSFLMVGYPDGSKRTYFPSNLPSGKEGVEITDLSISFWVDNEEVGCQFDMNWGMWQCQITLAEDGVSGPTAFVYVKK